MKTNEEIRDWILENCVDSDGNIVLSNLDFGDKFVFFDYIKASTISNMYQESKNNIDNEGQKAHTIYNDKQKAHTIYNDKQKGEAIYNHGQQAIYNINNKKQKAKKIYT